MYWVTFTPNFFAGTMWPISCSAIEASRPNAKTRTPIRYSSDDGTTRAPLVSPLPDVGERPRPVAGPRLCPFDVHDGTWVPYESVLSRQPLAQDGPDRVRDLQKSDA